MRNDVNKSCKRIQVNILNLVNIIKRNHYGNNLNVNYARHFGSDKFHYVIQGVAHIMSKYAFNPVGRFWVLIKFGINRGKSVLPICVSRIQFFPKRSYSCQEQQVMMV